MNKKFALIGAAGYIAPRHMQAIQDVGGELVAALDPHDSVGILDKYAPNCQFFTGEHRFRRFLDENHVDYISICSPNYLHYDHIMLAIGAGANAICEKPLVINPKNLETLRPYSHANRIHPILQLRHHPTTQWLKSRSCIDHKTIITYNTYRGPWYQYSWKGDPQKSGGLAVNIGIHLFDMLIFVYGSVKTYTLVKKSATEIIGVLKLEYADIDFHLSIQEQKIERNIEIDGVKHDLNFEAGNLHTKCYQEILVGRGLTIEDAEPSLLLTRRIENEL